jgi:TetR/AcrR family transcriptional regulator, cholesterol catabolism regulator
MAIETTLTNPDESAAAPRAVDWNNPRVSSILAAAAKCFARKGFSATTLAEIGKELGLRKSIVHYYFASKSALIHEVQSYTYHKFLERVKEAVRVSGDNPAERAMTAMKSLWEGLQSSPTSLWLNIEVWSAARRDDELKRRAAALQKDARRLIGEEVGAAVGANDPGKVEAASALILGVLNGLSVGEYLEGEQSRSREAYSYFLELLQLGMRAGNGAAGGPAHHTHSS